MTPTQIILYSLATMWACGTFVGMCYMVYDIFHGVAGRFVGALIGLPLWAALGFYPFAFIPHASGPVLAKLLESEWQCSSSHAETSTFYHQIGNTLVPLSTTTNVCDVYSRIKQ